MKVLIANKFLKLVGGSERYIFTLSELFKRSGIDTIFFGMDDKDNFPETSNKYLVKNNYARGNLTQKVRLVKNFKYSKEAYNKMKDLIQNEKPDFAVLNLINKNLTCSIIDALYEAKIPMVWVCHDLITICPSYLMLNGKGHICEKCINGDFINCFKLKCVRGSSLLSYLSYKEAEFIKKNNLSVMPKVCPMDGKSKREDIKKLLYDLSKQIPHVRANMYGAIKRSKIKGWNI